jgi:hypothetical protein
VHVRSGRRQHLIAQLLDNPSRELEKGRQANDISDIEPSGVTKNCTSNMVRKIDIGRVLKARRKIPRRWHAIHPYHVLATAT